MALRSCPQIESVSPRKLMGRARSTIHTMAGQPKQILVGFDRVGGIAARPRRRRRSRRVRLEPGSRSRPPGRLAGRSDRRSRPRASPAPPPHGSLSRAVRPAGGGDRRRRPGGQRRSRRRREQKRDRKRPRLRECERRSQRAVRRARRALRLSAHWTHSSSSSLRSLPLLRRGWERSRSCSSGGRNGGGSGSQMRSHRAS